MATVAAGREAASHPYTCNTCQVAFRSTDLQKSHMKDDWHRYNLKRRVASLPAISSEVFNEKVLQSRAATSAEADKVGFEKACDPCKKTFYSENSYQNHLGSQKHKLKLSIQTSGSQKGKDVDETSSVVSSTFSLGAPIPIRTVNKIDLDSDAEEEFNEVIQGMKSTNIQERPSPVKRPSNPHLSAAGQRRTLHPLSEPSSETASGSATPVNESKTEEETPELSITACVFCNYESPSSKLNVVHMERIHGMFIPEKQYLVDLDGLIKSLQQRVQEFHECIYCGKPRANAFAAQTHMRDSGHCIIPFTSEEEQLEIGEFYDFRSTYSDGEEDSEDEEEGAASGSGGAKLGMKRAAKFINEDGDEVVENGDGWETDSSASSLDSEDLTAVPAEKHYHQYERLDRHPHHSSHDSRAHHQRDGWHSHAHKHNHAVFYDEYELHLPTGRSVGHRSHNKYYRQNLRSHPSAAEREERLLAIEGAEAEPMDVDGLNRLMRRHGGAHRSLITRATVSQGMAGVSKPKAKEVQRAQHRSLGQKTLHQSRYEHKNIRRANFQQHFHYSKLGG